MDPSKQPKRLTTIFGLIYWIVLAACIAALLLCVNAENTFLPFAEEDLADFSEGWTTADGTPVSLHKLSAAVGEDGTVTVCKALPETIPAGSDLNFRSKNINFTVSLDGAEAYSFYPEASLHGVAGRSYGSCFHHIPIPSAFAGKVVSITAQPVYSDNSSFLSLLSLGNSGAYYENFLQKNLIPFLICMLIFFFGVVMLLLAVTIGSTQGSNYDLLSLGTLAVLLGLWSAMETLVPQLLTGTTVLYHGLNYLILILLPYPAVQFVNAQLARPSRRYTRIAFYTVMADLAVCSALNFLHIRDFHECLPLIHAVLMATVVSFFVMLWKNGRELRRRGEAGLGREMHAAFLVFMVFCMLDLWRYIASDRGSDDAGYFMRFGMLFYIIVLFLRSLRHIISRMRLASETEAIRRVAYTDALTGLGSRAAFVEKERELETAVRTGQLPEVLVCQMDINGLKQINDSLGHARGDEYIRSAAKLIGAAFDGTGECYRIGGDEFTVFISRQPAEESFLRCRDALAEAVARGNAAGEFPSPLHIACGSAVYRRGDESLEKTEIEADGAMYARKRDMKSL